MNVNPDQIGVLGFTLGAVAAMLASTNQYLTKYSLDDQPFAAAMPVYPVCWVYGAVPGYEFKELVGRPVQIVTGALDGYDDSADTCPDLVDHLTPQEDAQVSVHVPEDAHHSFDKPGTNRLVSDPYSHRGAGGDVQMLHNPEAMARSHELAVSFFAEKLPAQSASK